MDEVSCKSCPSLSVLQWKRGGNWRKHEAYPKQLHVKSPGQSPSIISKDTQVYIMFVSFAGQNIGKTNSASVTSANKIRACQGCRQALADNFCMPSFWWSDYLRNSNGYFGCATTRDADSLTGFNTWAFFETKQLDNNMHYQWSKLNIFTRWLSTNQTAILIFDPRHNDTIHYPFSDFPEPNIALLGDPFWVYILVIEEVARLQESAVWAIRNQVRKIETEQKPLGKPQPDYRQLHDIARHAIHVTETLDVSSQTLEHILRHHEHDTIPNQRFQIRQEVHCRLTFFQSYLSSMRDRSVSNEKRLQNEIQLAFNMVAQHDAGITVEISRAARSDSATMKTLAFITLTFLPPTFICTLFSMSFFDFSADSGGWSVSSKIWIYWAFAIPITAVTAFLWYFWSRLFTSKSVEENRTQITC